jgi:hypothetical protein
VETHQITQSLAYVSWVLLGGMALGGLALCWLLRQLTDATKGFLGFTAILSSAWGVLWLVVDLSLPAPDELVIGADATLDAPRQAAVGAFVALAFVAGARLLRGGTARWSGLAGVVLGALAMAIAALGWTGATPLAASYLVQLLALAAVTGGSVAAVVLAHWYLVTPRISERPLLLTTQLLMWAVGLQVLLFLAWQVVGIPEGPPFAALGGPQALFVWLRLVVGLLFPLVLVAMAHRTARTRSMESATGLLYIELAAVLASTIVAAALAVSVGLLV